MIVDFDPAKDAANRAKHGVPLIFGRWVFDDPEHVVLPRFARSTARTGTRRSG